MSREKHLAAVEFLKVSPISERNPKFRESVFDLDYKHLEQDEAAILESLYSNLKDISLRKGLLECLSRSKNGELKQFFFTTYKKERYLDMRLDALRGYANFASEEEIMKLMGNFMTILKKRPESTPYNYQEYEYLRSASGLPYLIKTYGYKCFVDAYNQVEIQYNNMPAAFRGIYTFDEEGNCIQLRDPEETKRMMDDFFKQKYNRS